MQLIIINSLHKKRGLYVHHTLKSLGANRTFTLKLGLYKLTTEQKEVILTHLGVCCTTKRT